MILMRHGQSEFNVVYSVTRVDPGIRDPVLTEEGRRQAWAAAEALAGAGVRRVLASPYRRALQTAAIIAESLDLPVSVDPIVGERAAFACDVGSPVSALCREWPGLRLDHLPESWWPRLEESHDSLLMRCARFRDRVLADTERQDLLVVSHWGFIRGLTGQRITNATWLRYDPVATMPLVEPWVDP
ncbi:MAG: histidine phosphatase family protein [Alphaproteobacteria bacterium]|nr:histidine phosphatase family protein [Alphaproteobacteria bacterium]